MRLSLDAMGYGFFIPIFFVCTAAGFDLRALTEARPILVRIPLFIDGSFVVTMVPALALGLHYPLRSALATGALLSARLSLVVAASTIGLDLGAIDEATHSAMMLVAVVTSTLSPVSFGWLRPKTIQQGERDNDTPDSSPHNSATL